MVSQLFFVWNRCVYDVWLTERVVNFNLQSNENIRECNIEEIDWNDVGSYSIYRSFLTMSRDILHPILVRSILIRRENYDMMNDRTHLLILNIFRSIFHFQSMILFMRWIHRCSSLFYATHLVYDCLLFFLSSNKLWCIDVVHLVNIIFRRFDILRCVLISMNMISYLSWSEEDGGRSEPPYAWWYVDSMSFSLSWRICVDKTIASRTDFFLNWSNPFIRHDVCKSNETSYSTSHQTPCYSSDHNELKSIWSNYILNLHWLT